MPYGLIFDVDGVLADTEPLIAKATSDMYREFYGFEATPEEFKPFIGTGAVRYTVGPAEARGVAITDLEAALARRTQNFVRLMESENITAAGALELIRAAAADPECRLGIATSSPTDKANKTLELARIPVELFTAVINGDMVTHKKPNPEIFLTAAAGLGLAPRDCVVVEDAITGVQGAKDAGAACLAVATSFSHEELAKADLIVDSLEEATLDAVRGLVAAASAR